VVSVTPWSRFTPGERARGTHCTGGWVGPRAGLDAKTKEKNPLPLSGIEPRPNIPLRLLPNNLHSKTSFVKEINTYQSADKNI
jgi:hypothetical protein